MKKFGEDEEGVDKMQTRTRGLADPDSRTRTGGFADADSLIAK